MQSHLGNGSAHNSQMSPEFRSFHHAENKPPWRCRVFRGSRCLCDRGRSRGGRSPGEPACTAAGRRRLPSTPPGGRSVGSGASRTATLCCTPDHRRCPGGGTGCCCASVEQNGFLLITRTERGVSGARRSHLVLPHAPLLREEGAGGALLLAVAVVEHWKQTGT